MAVQVFEVPLSPTPQRFSIPLAGVTYRMAVKWIETPGGGWILDIADALGQPILGGIPLVTGADLLAQYSYMGFGGSLIVQTDSDPDAVPTFDTLGKTSHLYFVVAGDG